MDGEKIGKLAARWIQNPMLLVQELRRLHKPVKESWDFQSSDWSEGKWWREFSSREEYSEWGEDMEFVTDVIRVIMQIHRDSLPWKHLHNFDVLLHGKFFGSVYLGDFSEQVSLFNYSLEQFHAAVLAMQSEHMPVDDTPVTAQQLATHCGCTAAQIRVVLSDCPRETNAAGANVYRYNDTLPLLRDWSAGHRHERFRAVKWPNLAVNLRTKPPADKN